MAADRLDAELSPGRKSSRTHSVDTTRTRRSQRSASREQRDGSRRERDRDHYGSRSHGHRRSRSRDRYRDRDRDREHRSHDYERRRRREDRDKDSHRGDRDRDRDERDRRERRRKREDDVENSPDAKRKKGDDGPDAPHRSNSRDPERRHSRHREDRHRPRRDPREPSERPPPSPPRPPSPGFEPQDDYNPEEPKEDDSETRSVFVSQLAARLTARDLGYFFEEKLGEGTVLDSRIVTDRISRRSKGIGYVEFRTVEIVEKALNLNGTIVMGLPIAVQYTEAERNRTHAGDGNLNLPPGVSHRGGMQLYVGSLHFNLTESDIRQVFEPFGELEFVDLHRDPVTGRSKGYAFIQYKRTDDAKMALEQMEGFELAGRTLRVNTVHEKGSGRYTQQDSLEDSGGGNLNAASRQALMQKLARTENSSVKEEAVVRPHIPQTMTSRSVVLKNMFDPTNETERDWDKDLADEVKGECEEKYGRVEAIKVDKDSLQGEIFVKFDNVDSAKKAVQGLSGRWFGGQQVSATFISDALMQAYQ